MNKNFRLGIIIIIFFFIMLGFINYADIKSLTLNMSITFITNVFPFLLFMMLLNKMLIYFKLPNYINGYVYLFIMSLLSGAPVSAIIIKEYLDKKYINTKNASLLLMFTNFNNPLFLYNYFKLIFNNNYIIIKLFSIIYVMNLIGFIIVIKRLPLLRKIDEKGGNFGSVFNEVSQNLLSIFITITFFKIISNLIMPNNSFFSIMGKGFIELTEGLNSLLKYDGNLLKKELLTMIILLFNGFSIHIQISNILANYNINYKYFYISKIILITLGSALVLVFHF